jgi:hypothetical protein
LTGGIGILDALGINNHHRSSGMSPLALAGLGD